MPKVLWEPLRKHFVLFTTKVVRATTSTDQTHKLLIELQDGLRVETVVISKGASTARRKATNRARGAWRAAAGFGGEVL